MTMFDIVMLTLFGLMMFVAGRALFAPPRRNRGRARNHHAAATSWPILMWFGIGSATYAASESNNDAASDWGGGDFGGGSGFDGGGQ